MKNYLKILDKESSFKTMKELAGKKVGKETADEIWEEGRANFSRLLKHYEGAPKAHHKHLYESILPRVSIYQSLLKHMSQEEAMGIIDETVKINGGKVGDILHNMTSLPLMKGFFMKAFPKMIEMYFGEKNGFKSNTEEISSKVLDFEILQCPYHKTCCECSCPELTHTFCDSDVYCYGNLSGIKFERTKTIGTGGDMCDFKLTREKKK